MSTIYANYSESSNILYLSNLQHFAVLCDSTTSHENHFFGNFQPQRHADFGTDGSPSRPRTPGTGVRTIDSKFQCSSSPPAEKQEACALGTDGSPSRPRTPGTGVRTIDSKFTNSKL